MGRKNSVLPVAPRIISLGIQDLHLRHRFPGFSYHWTRGRAIWHGTLQPREASAAYVLEITYPLAGRPTVKVLSPSLRPGAPHLYHDGTLCLYWPKEWQWQKDQLVAETIVPWAALWLLYYELWLDTGKWLGPSSHDPVLSDH